MGWNSSFLEIMDLSSEEPLKQVVAIFHEIDIISVCCSSCTLI